MSGCVRRIFLEKKSAFSAEKSTSVFLHFPHMAERITIWNRIYIITLLGSKGMPKNLGTVFQICEDFIKKSQENNIIKNLDFSFYLLCTYRIYKRVQYVRSVSRRLLIVYLTTIYANTWISQISLRKPKKATSFYPVHKGPRLSFS